MSDKRIIIEADGDFYNLDFLVRVTTGKNKEHYTLYFNDSSSIDVEPAEWERIKTLLDAEIIGVTKHKPPPLNLREDPLVLKEGEPKPKDL